MADLEKRTASLKESIAKNEADRAALSQAEADLLKTDHRIELAEGLSADCRQLLQNLADADKADEDAAARQAEYVAAQAALELALRLAQGKVPAGTQVLTTAQQSDDEALAALDEVFVR